VVGGAAEAPDTPATVVAPSTLAIMFSRTPGRPPGPVRGGSP
jgi:hypothetical protein